MAQLATEQIHPMSGAPLMGLRLFPGAILFKGDFYASRSGQWEKSPISADLPDYYGSGIELGRTDTVWVRPESVLSERARSLLATLARHYPGKAYTCVVEFSSGDWFNTPGPNYRWCDGPCAVYPVDGGQQAVSELIACGFLEHDSWGGVATLTQLGGEAGLKLCQGT